MIIFEINFLISVIQLYEACIDHIQGPGVVMGKMMGN